MKNEMMSWNCRVAVILSGAFLAFATIGCVEIEGGNGDGDGETSERVSCLEQRPDPASCTVVPRSGSLTSERKLEYSVMDEPCYILEGLFDVTEGQTTIEPGTVLYFGENAGIRLHSQGSISAVGTEDEPVCFLGLEEERGHWRGLRLLESSAPGSVLDHVVLQNAGSETWTTRRQPRNHGGIVLTGEDTSLTVSNSYFSQNMRAAIIATDSGESNLVVNSSTFEDNEIALKVHAEDVRNIGTDVVIEGNDLDALVINSAGTGSNYLTISTSWPARDVPYRVMEFMSVTGGAHFQVEPGAHFLFEEDSGIRVSGGAAMTAEGTSEAPIVFEGTEAVAGHWRGLYFTATQSPDNKLSHIEVHHGGGHQWHHGRETSQGNIVLSSNSTTCSVENLARVDISNALITHSAQFGITVRSQHEVTGGCGSITFENIANKDVHDENTDRSEGGGCFCSSGPSCDNCGG